MGIHDGHRERLLNRFLEYGLDAFDDVTALELLLFFVSARQDTNPLAHRLLNRFGSLAGVLEASFEDLEATEGMGRHAAALVKLALQMGRRYSIDRAREIATLDTPSAVGEYICPFFIGAREELVYIVFLSSGYRLLTSKLLIRGNLHSVEVDAGRVAELALQSKAAYVVLSHNHPSGDMSPSADDRLATDELTATLRRVGIRLADHIIVANDEYYSMMEQGDLGS